MSGRYDSCDQLVFVTPSGARLQYLGMRILPDGASVASGAQTAVQANEVDRLDLVSYRTLNNALLAWRIADANNAMDPFELCAHRRTILQLPGPQL